jgi:hypothetical protein
MRAPKCIACGKALDEGFLLDKGYGSDVAGSWVAGAPVKSIWGGVKLWGRPRLDVHALRCRGCGLLHLYAPGSPPVGSFRNTGFER